MYETRNITQGLNYLRSLSDVDLSYDDNQYLIYAAEEGYENMVDFLLLDQKVIEGPLNDAIRLGATNVIKNKIRRHLPT